MLEQDGAGAREPDPAARLLEQGDAQLALQRLDLLPQRGFGDADTVGGRAVGAGAGYLGEVPQVPEFHRYLL